MPPPRAPTALLPREAPSSQCASGDQAAARPAAGLHSPTDNDLSPSADGTFPPPPTAHGPRPQRVPPSPHQASPSPERPASPRARSRSRSPTAAPGRPNARRGAASATAHLGEQPGIASPCVPPGNAAASSAEQRGSTRYAAANRPAASRAHADDALPSPQSDPETRTARPPRASPLPQPADSPPPAARPATRARSRSRSPGVAPGQPADWRCAAHALVDPVDSQRADSPRPPLRGDSRARSSSPVRRRSPTPVDSPPRSTLDWTTTSPTLFPPAHQTRPPAPRTPAPCWPPALRRPPSRPPTPPLRQPTP